MSFTKINCPACDQSIELPKAMRGGPVKCPTCDIGFIAPGKPTRSRNTNWVALWIGGSAFILLGALMFAMAVNDQARESIAYILLFGCGLALYFVPAIVASQRQHPNREAITVLNLVAGWTLLGWVVALV